MIGGAREITAGIGEINQAMASIQTLTQRNREQISAIAEAIAVFHRGEDGEFGNGVEDTTGE